MFINKMGKFNMRTSTAPSQWEIAQGILKHSIRSRLGLFIMSFLVSFVFLIGCRSYFGSAKWPDVWGYIDQVLTLLTLMFAFLVWFGTTSLSWINSLPKKLNVEFIYNGRVIIKCIHANLPHEADIRNLGQQIGRQMVPDNPILQFKPESIRYEKSKRAFDNEGNMVNEFAATFTLSKIPYQILEDNIPIIRSPPFDIPLTAQIPGEAEKGRYTIDLKTFFNDVAKLADLPTYINKALDQAGEGDEIVLTGKAPVWLYLAVAHALHGKAKKLVYRSPVTDDVVIFDHNPF